MKYNIEMNTLEEKGSFLRKLANEEIEKKIIELEKLKNELEWSGTAHDSYCKKYKDVIGKLHSITKTIDQLGYYMEYASGKYNDSDKNVKGEFNKYKNEAESVNVGIMSNE